MDKHTREILPFKALRGLGEPQCRPSLRSLEHALSLPLLLRSSHTRPSLTRISGTA